MKQIITLTLAGIGAIWVASKAFKSGKAVAAMGVDGVKAEVNKAAEKIKNLRPAPSVQPVA